VFAGAVSLALYGIFVFVQTVRHRDYFLPADVGNAAAHAPPVANHVALLSMGLMLLCLVAVVGLAKKLSPSIEAGVHAAKAPVGVVGIAIAMLVLLPESWAALRAAAANRVQTSLNLALGSALASIGLTIPGRGRSLSLSGPAPRTGPAGQRDHPSGADRDRGHTDAQRGPRDGAARCRAPGAFCRVRVSGHRAIGDSSRFRLS